MNSEFLHEFNLAKLVRGEMQNENAGNECTRRKNIAKM